MEIYKAFCLDVAQRNVTFNFFFFLREMIFKSYFEFWSFRIFTSSQILLSAKYLAISKLAWMCRLVDKCKNVDTNGASWGYFFYTKIAASFFYGNRLSLYMPMAFICCWLWRKWARSNKDLRPNHYRVGELYHRHLCHPCIALDLAVQFKL